MVSYNEQYSSKKKKRARERNVTFGVNARRITLLC
jgi:hypothetical protein